MNIKFKERLESERLYFRPFEDEDAESVFEYSSDEETTKFISWRPHKSIKDSLNSIQNFLKQNGKYAVVHKSTDKLIGCFDVSIVEEKKATFGFVLNRKYWNNGYMSEALSVFIDYLFSETGVEEIVSAHQRGNVASGKVMLKCNMKWQYLKKGEIINNRIGDYDHYSIKKTT